MNFFHLKCFQTVAEKNHITHAAEKLNIAQPALSGIIGKLEKEMGLALFDRAGRQISLNENGQAFLVHVNKILKEWDDAVDDMNHRKSVGESILRIAVTGQLFPQQIIMGFKLKHPATLIKQHLVQTPDIVETLLAGKNNFVISTIPIEHELIQCTPFFKEKLYLLVSCSHPFATHAFVQLSELEDESLITLPDGYAFRDMIDAIFAEESLQMNVVYESFPSQFGELVSRDFGVAFVSESTVRTKSYPNQTVAIPLMPEHYRTLYLLSNKNAAITAIGREFQEYVLTFNQGLR